MSEWISVEDRLPEEIIEEIIVCRDKDCIASMAARYIGGEFITYGAFGADMPFKNPTHWMPLPEPPKKT